MARYATSIEGLFLLHAGLSDQGCRRPRNEDALGFEQLTQAEGTFLLVVADGVGGNAAGDVASKLAVEAVVHFFRSQRDLPDLGSLLRQAIVVANQRILQEANCSPDRVGMATTCTAAAVRGLQAVVGHVGDCRAYLGQNERLQRITQDHNLAADYQRQGMALPPEQQILANVLTRWLGTDLEIMVDILNVDLERESSLLLCSDGLTKVVTDEEIRQWLLEHPPDQACRGLVDLALQRGGPDNITVQVARLVGA
jgi:serine/threonine protein phosphatase PrpC